MWMPNISTCQSGLPIWLVPFLQQANSSKLLEGWYMWCDSHLLVPVCFQDLKGTLQQELDFEQEARNGEQCREDLCHLDYVYVPEILWNTTSKVKAILNAELTTHRGLN